MDVGKILEIIRDEARQADSRAAEACKRSKYSMQEYHICIEFHLQKLHDRIAREAGLPIRCPIYPMRVRIAELRRMVAREFSSIYVSPSGADEVGYIR
jgi:hypothetical protein